MSGDVHVFVTYDGGASWNQTQKVSASDKANLDQFGNSVAVYGRTMAVGAQGDRNGLGIGQSAIIRVSSLLCR